MMRERADALARVRMCMYVLIFLLSLCHGVACLLVAGLLLLCRFLSKGGYTTRSCFFVEGESGGWAFINSRLRFPACGTKTASWRNARRILCSKQPPAVVCRWIDGYVNIQETNRIAVRTINIDMYDGNSYTKPAFRKYCSVSDFVVVMYLTVCTSNRRSWSAAHQNITPHTWHACGVRLNWFQIGFAGSATDYLRVSLWTEMEGPFGIRISV